MVPQEHYDNPESLSSMGMKTVPKYADETPAAAGQAPGVSIDPSAMQNLGIRLATATGAIDFNQRDVAIIQARAAGFIQVRLSSRARRRQRRRGADRRRRCARVGRCAGRV